MKKEHRTGNYIVSFVVVALLALAGCGPGAGAGADTEGKLNVVSTIGQINDVVGVIGGEHVEAIGLMGPGVDPHLYQASEGDVRKLSGADIIFYNGLHLESQMIEVFEQMQRSITTVAVADAIPEHDLIVDETFVGFHDPHVWFEVPLWRMVAVEVRDTLVEEDPANAAAYEANAAAYLEELDALDTYVREQVALVPEEQRVLVTAHDAFGYFGGAYGFEVHGLQGLSTETEAGTRDVQDLADFIADRKIKAMFIESSIPERNIKAVQEAVKSRGWDVVIGGELFSDAMGDEGTLEGTYLGMVRHNVDTIAGALS